VKEYGAHVNVRAGNGATPLYLAASQGHAQMIRELMRVDGDCDPNAQGLSLPCMYALLHPCP